MQPAVLRALEFDRIREALAREASTSLGRARALVARTRHGPRRGPPAPGPDDRGRGVHRSRPAASSIDGPDDLPDILDHLDIDGEPLAPLQLLGLARFVVSVTSVVDRVRAARSAAALRPGRRARARSSPKRTPCGARSSRRATSRDDASPALRDIRDALRRQRAKLRSSLEGLTRGRDTAKYLQDQIVTDRNGRYVHRRARRAPRARFRASCTAASASGASLYLEPLSTVELNNDVVALAEREKEEIHRILLALTDAFRARGDDLAAPARWRGRPRRAARQGPARAARRRRRARADRRRAPRVPRRASSAADSRGARPARTR